MIRSYGQPGVIKPGQPARLLGHPGLAVRAVSDHGRLWQQRGLARGHHRPVRAFAYRCRGQLGSDYLGISGNQDEIYAANIAATLP